MDRTTIMLPRGLKARAQQRAHELGISLAELIRESLEKDLDGVRVRTRAQDSLFREVPIYRGHAPEDLSAAHDRYLYGDD